MSVYSSICSTCSSPSPLPSLNNSCSNSTAGSGRDSPMDMDTCDVVTTHSALETLQIGPQIKLRNRECWWLGSTTFKFVMKMQSSLQQISDMDSSKNPFLNQTLFGTVSPPPLHLQSPALKIPLWYVRTASFYIHCIHTSVAGLVSVLNYRHVYFSLTLPINQSSVPRALVCLITFRLGHLQRPQFPSPGGTVGFSDDLILLSVKNPLSPVNHFQEEVGTYM